MEWKAVWWESKANVEHFSGAHAEGVIAYAGEQAEVWRDMKRRFLTRTERKADGSFVQASLKFHQRVKGAKQGYVDSHAESRGRAVTATILDKDNSSEEEEEEDQREEVWVDEVEEGVNLTEEGVNPAEDEEDVDVEDEDVDPDVEELDLEVLATASKYGPAMDF